MLGARAGAPNRKRRRIHFLAKRRPDRPDQDAALIGGKRELAGPREQSTGLDVFVCDGRCSIQVYAVKEACPFSTFYFQFSTLNPLENMDITLVFDDI